MNIFNHAWSDMTDVHDLLYIQTQSYDYNASESVSIDIHAF